MLNLLAFIIQSSTNTSECKIIKSNYFIAQHMRKTMLSSRLSLLTGVRK